MPDERMGTCAEPNCGHAEAQHFSCEVGSFCTLCKDDHDPFQWEHVFRAKPLLPASEGAAIEMLAKIQDALPATYFADRTLLWRVQNLVRDWQRVIRVNQQLEVERGNQ